jgi:hypothetical protein
MGLALLLAVLSFLWLAAAALSLPPPLLTSLPPGCTVCPRSSSCFNDTVAVDNALCVQLPLLVLRPYSVQGVVNAVQWAASNGVHLTARSGGHSAGCFGLNADGVVLDMRLLNAMSWDDTGTVLTAQAGLLWQ